MTSAGEPLSSTHPFSYTIDVTLPAMLNALKGSGALPPGVGSTANSGPAGAPGAERRAVRRCVPFVPRVRRLSADAAGGKPVQMPPGQI